METLFAVRELCKYYRGKKETVLKALDGVSFDIYQGETLGVVGESGSGKSTLGRCILNLIKPTGGSVLYKGNDIKNLKQNAKDLRCQMQMVFQNPVSSFNPRTTIGRTLFNVAAFYGMSKNEAEKRVVELIEYVKLDGSVLGRRSNELSGGQLQRLAIVRALIPSPAFIMADEPVSALDVSVQAQILNLIGRMKKTFGLTMLFISHELTVVEHSCDRILVMYLGIIVEIGETGELFANPLHPYTKALIASRPKMYPEEKIERIMLEGEIPSAMDIPPGCRFFSRCPAAVTGICEKKSPPLRQVSGNHWVSCFTCNP
jgi:peptide/nickel transport system ATP-binding protein/oligopeptide transport system ATP-binding protein